jgi:sugar phosphate isomerase/epimerase
MIPKVAMCNIFPDIIRNRDFAAAHGFSGIDWSFDMEALPSGPAEESRWAKGISILAPLEVRYHCPFYRMDLGHDDPGKAREAGDLFRRIIRMVSKVAGRYLSIHIGLGRNSTEPLSWDLTIENLLNLVRYGAEHRVRVCLENLAWGWTSKPHLFEKLIRKSGAGVTFDFGHARASEAIQTQLFAMEDFLAPHRDSICNAHIYHIETPGLGHFPPDRLGDIEDRLDLLRGTGCRWWVIEVREEQGLLKTKAIIDRYLEKMSSLKKEQEAEAVG